MKSLLDVADIDYIKRVLKKDLYDATSMMEYSKNLTSQCIYEYFKNRKENIENLLKKLEELKKEK